MVCILSFVKSARFAPSLLAFRQVPCLTYLWKSKWVGVPDKLALRFTFYFLCVKQRLVVVVTKVRSWITHTLKSRVLVRFQCHSGQQEKPRKRTLKLLIFTKYGWALAQCTAVVIARYGKVHDIPLAQVYNTLLMSAV